MAQQIQIDIISDVVCPWCWLGYRRLKQAIDALGENVEVHLTWHPFELNPDMIEGGENLREHLMRKYQISEEDSIAARANITQLGLDMGINYNFFDGMRIYNTAKAHQLLHWAGLQRKQTELKLAMFEAYFSNKANLEDPETLLDIAESCGLDRDKASEILTEDRYLDQIRDEETKWRHMGITGVPATILENQYLISGAQEPAYFQRALEQLISDLQSGKVG